MSGKSELPALTGLPTINGAQQLERHLSLETWTPSTPLPKEASSKAKLIQAQAWVTRALTPAPPEVWAHIADRLTMFTMAYNVGTKDLTGALTLYGQLLAHLPADLLALAFRRCMGTWKWHNSMPTPAEVEEHVEEEMAARRTLQGCLVSAMRQADKEAQDNDQARKEAESAAWWERQAKAQGKTVQELKDQAAMVRENLAAGRPLFSPKPEPEIDPEKQANREAIQNALRSLAPPAPTEEIPW